MAHKEVDMQAYEVLVKLTGHDPAELHKGDKGEFFSKVPLLQLHEAHNFCAFLWRLPGTPPKPGEQNTAKRAIGELLTDVHKTKGETTEVIKAPWDLNKLGELFLTCPEIYLRGLR